MRNQKADLIKQKYEIITREYDQQNKNFAGKHAQIAEEEENRKKEIRASFETHMKNIRQQMEEEKDAPDRKLNIEDTIQL